MEIIAIGGIVALIVLMIIVRSVMTSRERQGTRIPNPGAGPSSFSGATIPGQIPPAFSGTVPGGEAISIMNVGPKKIQVIKVIREYTGLGLKDAKDLADAATKSPMLVAKDLSAAVANDFRRELEQAGATVGVSSAHMVEPETTETMETDVVTIQIEWIDVGPRKINVIKIIRQYTSFGLAEAKKATEIPSFSVTMPANLATQFLIDLREAGATANVHGI